MNLAGVLKINKQNVYIGKSPKGYGFTFFAKKDFKKNDLIAHGYGKIINHQTAHCSIQIDFNKHILPTKWTGRYWNHSCNPSAYMSTREKNFPDLKALKNIKKGEEITYSYWMSEYDWAKHTDESKINCICGEKNCKNKILSFSQLDKKYQNKMIKKSLCAKYLWKK